MKNFAVTLPEKNDKPANIISLLVSTSTKEIDYAKKLLSLAIEYSISKKYTFAISWFKEDSLFHRCLKPYLKNEIKWYHGSLIT